MKLSSKAQYGVQAVFDMAFNIQSAPVQIKDIAERQAIPARFLEQIFQDLRRAGLVTSKRGPKGGYTLAKAPDSILLGEVIRAVEGDISIGHFDEKNMGPHNCRRVVAEVFSRLSHSIQACFDEVTFRDLCTRGDELGLQRNHVDRTMYYI